MRPTWQSSSAKKDREKFYFKARMTLSGTRIQGAELSSWGAWPLSSHSTQWVRGWWWPSIPSIPQPLATHGKSDLLVSKAIREAPISCSLWLVEMGAVSGYFSSAGLLCPIGHIVAPGPWVLQEWKGRLFLVSHNVHRWRVCTAHHWAHAAEKELCPSGQPYLAP